MGNTIGYARVSTTAQAKDGTSLESQRQALTAAGASRVFAEAVSGKKASRPELDAMLDYLREGDTVLVASLDRMGRTMADLVTLVNQLQDRGINFRSIREGIDTSGPAGRMVFHVFAALAEFEHATILERTEKGRQAAAEKGRKGGRPRKYDAKKVALVKRLHGAGDMTPREVADAAGVSVSTMYRLLKMEAPAAA
ncbi:recombinase family protein [Micrococcus luteus]|uniref:recombinase family protein n=1 Tax=Micrococcus luteus TaxID=1270 RepID=UPI0011A56144|nr:recombinase family protein [Micrococcus luteus]